MIETVTTLPALHPRDPEGHKGTYGRVLVIAGSRGMTGAAILCGSAAMRTGAGLVRVAVPAEILPIVAAGNPCYTTAALPQDSDGRIAHAAFGVIERLWEDHDVIAVGPGLGQSHDLTALMIDLIEKSPRPMVIDADGLNAFVGHVDRLHGNGTPRIITPHPGELARLLHTDNRTLQSQRQSLAVQFASEQSLIVALKGHRTIVTDGQRFYENATGNPGMATGGTGDVLTGVIAALLGQHLSPFDATVLGVHVHGKAGDLARDQIGEVSLIATDLLDFLAPALRQAVSIV